MPKKIPTWEDRYYGWLKGKTIVSAGGGSGEDAYPFFVVRDPGGGPDFKVEVSRDEEGNGPGFLFGLPEPEKV